MLWTYSIEKGFISVSLLPFTEKLDRYSYDVTMTRCDVIPKWFLFKFVPYVQYL